MPWVRQWVPPGPPPGAPPWLPLPSVGGYWTRVYVPTAQESAEASRRAQEFARKAKERARGVAAASEALARAGTVVEIAQLVEPAGWPPGDSGWTLDMFDEASCLSAWRALLASEMLPATHDLVEWRVRSREWAFYFRGLPPTVVRATSRPRESVWKLPGANTWVGASGDYYRIAGTSPVAQTSPRPEVHDGLLDPGSARWGQAIVPRGERFRTEHRGTDRGPVHFVAAGFQVEPAGLPRGMERVNAHALSLFLSV